MEHAFGYLHQGTYRFC